MDQNDKWYVDTWNANNKSKIIGKTRYALIYNDILENGKKNITPTTDEVLKMNKIEDELKKAWETPIPEKTKASLIWEEDINPVKEKEKEKVTFCEALPGLIIIALACYGLYCLISKLF